MLHISVSKTVVFFFPQEMSGNSAHLRCHAVGTHLIQGFSRQSQSVLNHGLTHTYLAFMQEGFSIL